MKIIHIINTFPGLHKRVGGAEQACKSVVEELSNRNFEIELYTTKFEFNKTSGIYKIGWLPILEDFTGKTDRYVEILKWYLIQFDPLAFISSLILFRKTKPDIVHFHNIYKLTFAVVLAAKILNKPVCLSIYDYWCFCPLSTLFDFENKICRKFHGVRCVKCLPGKFRLIQKIIIYFRKAIFDYFLNKIDKFIVLSKSSFDILESYGIKSDKIMIIPLMVADEHKSLAEPTADKKSGEANILFIGWLQKRKGLHVLLNAMETVWNKFPDAKLNIIIQEAKWEDEYKRGIYGHLEKIPKEKYFVVSGQLSRDEITKHIKNADIVVIPEQWENMSPVLVIEAMALGKKIVASRIGGIPEFIRHNIDGLLAVSNDSLSFALNITEMISNKEKAKQLAFNAQKRIRELEENCNPILKLEEVYSRL